MGREREGGCWLAKFLKSHQRSQQWGFQGISGFKDKGTRTVSDTHEREGYPALPSPPPCPPDPCCPVSFRSHFRDSTCAPTCLWEPRRLPFLIVITTTMIDGMCESLQMPCSSFAAFSGTSRHPLEVATVIMPFSFFAF